MVSFPALAFLPPLDDVTLAHTLAAIVQSSDDAIVSKDLNGIIKSWNPAAVRMFGYTEEEAVGQPITMIIPKERLHEEAEVIARIRRDEPVDHFETVRQRKDGSLLNISLTVSPVKDGSGTIVGASKVARDITSRVESEDAARKSMEIKDQFLSLVSHELRTPIAIIVGNAQMLTRRGDTLEESDKAQALADVTFEAERLQRIIENLLLLTRVEAGEQLELEIVHLERLVTQAMKVMARRAPDRAINFRISGDVPPAIGEATLVALVLENLLSNADKYSPPDAEIDVRLSANENGMAEVHVLDRGVGFASTPSEDLFAPFYRSDTAKEHASGMGLGLAVCRKAVEEQGGTIGATERTGGGSDFWFTLKLAPAAEYA